MHGVAKPEHKAEREIMIAATREFQLARKREHETHAVAASTIGPSYAEALTRYDELLSQAKGPWCCTDSLLEQIRYQSYVLEAMRDLKCSQILSHSPLLNSAGS